MKSKPKIPVVVESQPAAASLLKYPLRDIRRAKAAGCLAFEPGGRIRLSELKAWLEKHPAKKQATPTASELPLGFNAAFARLVEAEARAFMRMESAGDDDERARMRREWAALLVEVRKHANVSGDMGDLVNRRDVEKSLRVFAGYLLSCIQGELSEVCPRLTGLANPADVAKILHPLAMKIFNDAISRAADYTAGTTPGFPDWAGNSITRK
ncbi:MAG TPA: hypothetical protein VFM25_01805 [Verrucomicrobiae bacterium]|nr:hypothetical protein [Verrucomicrobiae bacterium]